MTKRLYYDSAYLSEWQTGVTDAFEREDGWYVTLEETAFYPHGGGQPCDEGTIDGIPVLDVTAEGDEVLHKVERLPETGAVTCRIDWTRRFDHMQQHSGQHLLSAMCRKLYQAVTVSFHLGADYATIDLDKPELTADELAVLEREVNRHIYLNHGIISYFVTAEEAARLQLVKQPKVTENIRIVETKDVEYNACGGTHVSAIGEIGMIKLLRTEKQKGNTRIFFKCGYRALEEVQENQRILGALTAKFKTGKESLLDRIEKGELEQKQLHDELAALKELNDEYAARELLKGADGDGLIARVLENRTLKDVQNLANRLAAATPLPLLFAIAGENKTVLAHNGDFPLSCGAFFKENLGAFNGKGGGSDKMAQAGFPDWANALAFYEYAKAKLSADSQL